MALPSEKIEKLKDLMCFGFLLLDCINTNTEFKKFIDSIKHDSDKLIEFLAKFVCSYDYENAESKVDNMFNKKYLEILLEVIYEEFMKFKNTK